MVQVSRRAPPFIPSQTIPRECRGLPGQQAMPNMMSGSLVESKMAFAAGKKKNGFSGILVKRKSGQNVGVFNMISPKR